MAWNPSPEVAAARDAARKIGSINGSKVEHCIVFYTLEDGRFGYASYGKDIVHCAGAMKLADVLYEEAMKYFREQNVEV